VQGQANFILDNLIAAGKAKPMIVVMDKGYAGPPGQASLFEQVVLNDIVPAIDRTYRTLAKREQRAIAGLSMGGGQALQIGLTHLDTFSAIAAFSGSPRATLDLKSAYNGAFAEPAVFNRKVRLLWLGAGTAEAGAHKSALAFHEALEKAGIRNTFYSVQGTAHEWQTWRRHLNEFAPLLFR
jgi:enterochelin esterase family protein